MDQDIVRFGFTAFVTLLVVVDPPGVVPIFVALTQNQQDRRRAILTRAVLIAFGVALFFLIAGRGAFLSRRHGSCVLDQRRRIAVHRGAADAVWRTWRASV